MPSGGIAEGMVYRRCVLSGAAGEHEHEMEIDGKFAYALDLRAVCVRVCVRVCV